MRAYLCGLLLCSVIVNGFAEQRRWFTNPMSSGGGMGVNLNVTFVDQYWTVVLVDFPEGVNPNPPVGSEHGAWSRSFKNFAGESIYNFWYIDEPADANTMQPPGILPLVGSNYYLTWEVPVLGHSYGPKVDAAYPYTANISYSDVGMVYCNYSTNYVPDPDYHCYFDLEGVAFFDGQTNKYFSADLWIIIPEAVFWHAQTYIVSDSGAYTKSYGPYFISKESGRAIAGLYQHFWLINTPGQLETRLDGPAMSGSNPDDFHYVTKLDFTDYNTNSPYVPPVPTNSLPDPYIPYPGDDAYDPEEPPGPWPPYYSPWPPNYYPPPPLTEWPQYPPPNWPYNTNSPYNPPGPDDPTPDPNNPTNYVPPDPGNTNGGGGYTLAQWYDMLRSALSDEANSYTPSDPAQYGLTYSNDLLRAASDYTEKHFAESDKIQADADAFFVKAKGILDVVSLTLPSVGIKESFSFTFPYLDQVVEIRTSDWPIIGVFRTFMKWIMALLSFWIAFVMIKRTFGRV